MKKDTESNWKLGMFVTIGIVLLVVVIYFIGKQQNLFGSTFYLKAQFKTVSGLSVGNNVRFSGINIGTVDAIEQITDSSVVVVLKIEKDAQKFIKTDAMVTIGSDGLMGDKVMTISPGTSSNKIVKDNSFIASKSPVEMEDLMNSLKVTIDNAGIITGQLAEFTHSMNNKNGTLSQLMNDEEFSNGLKNTLGNLEKTTNEFSKFTTSMNSGKGILSKLVNDKQLGIKLDSTMSNLQSGTKGLSENMEAAKHNFLLRGYFNKKEKAEEKKQEELDKAEEKELEELQKAIEIAPKQD